mmetsp:Transcript_21319/g.56133  ORF Transcript_21319/g.56133 Transcript_21319/m.56133 type:complete len:424 (+) Transcript_21319:199-1470(+)
MLLLRNMHPAPGGRRGERARPSLARARECANSRLGREGLERLADLEGADGLEEAGAVLRAGRVLVVDNLLGHLAVVLGAGVAQLRLDVDQLVERLDLAVHLEHRDGLAEPLVLVRLELDARRGRRQLVAVGHPRDVGALVHQVRRRQRLDRVLGDQLHLEELARRVVDEVREEHLDDDVGLRLLRLNVRGEVGLAAVDRGLHVLHGRAALGNIALRLPRELDLVRDVKVDGQVERLSDAIVVHRVQALEDDDRRRRHLLVRVELARDVVVDGLADGLAGLEVGHVSGHLVPVLARLVQGGDAIGPLRVGLAASAVPLVVVVQADDSRNVRDERVRLTANVQQLALAAEDRRQAAHEGGLAAARVGSDADDDRVKLDHLHVGARHARLRHDRGGRRERQRANRERQHLCCLLSQRGGQCLCRFV